MSNENHKYVNQLSFLRQILWGQSLIDNIPQRLKKVFWGRNQLAHLNQDQLLLRIDQKLGGG